MIVLAIVPPIWRRVMDPRVVAHFDGDISRANLSPRRRDRILARYATHPPVAPVETTDDARTVVSTSSTVGDGDGDGDGDAAGDGARDEALSWRCPGCGYTYEVVAGEEREGFAAGTAWSEVPDTWCCPDCGVREKVDFVPMASTVVGW
jgi:alkane 1-monooxygenase